MKVLQETRSQTNNDKIIFHVMTCLSVPLEILDNIAAVGTSFRFGFMGVDSFRIPRVLS